jgi:hypothetical protein
MKNNLKVTISVKKRNFLVPLLFLKKCGVHKRSKRKNQRDLSLFFKKGVADV